MNHGWKRLPRRILQCALFLVLTAGMVSHGAWAADAKPPAGGGGASAGAATDALSQEGIGLPSRSFPRRLRLPPLSLTVPGEAGTPRDPLDLVKSRFTVVAILASWSPRASQVARVLSEKSREFESRGISIVGAFSHDTERALENWMRVEKPRFTLGLASHEFLDKLGNPKVPSLWVVNHRGEIVTRSELPEDADLKVLFSRLRTWTDF